MNNLRKILAFFFREKDTDKDKLTDYEEIFVYGTDPFDPDTDKDKVPDGEEVRLDRNPKGPGPLKNLFIPSKENDYQPRILHPRRVLFYSIAVVLVKCVLIIFVAAFPAAAWLIPDFLSQESQKIIVLTNGVRQKVSAPSLSENNLLTSAAFNKAQDMLVQQYFAHVGPDGRDLSDWISGAGYPYTVAGENLAIGFASADEVVNAWINSPTHYRNLIDTDFKHIGVGMAAGAYNSRETTVVAQYFGLASPSFSQTLVSEDNEDSDSGAEVIEEEKPPADESSEPEVASVQANANISQPEPAEITPPESPLAVNISGPQTAPAEEIIKLPPPPPETKTAPVEAFILEPGAEDLSPRIVLPQELLFENRPAKVLVYAPKSEGLKIKVNDGEFKELYFFGSEFYDLTLSLKEGDNELVLVSKVDGQDLFSEVYALDVSDNPPFADGSLTKVVYSQTSDKSDAVISAVAYLSDDAATAEIILENRYFITLMPAENRSDDLVKWTGSLVIISNDKRDLFDTVTLPVLKITDISGNQTLVDVAWENVIPLESSLFKQYSYLKAFPLSQINMLFDFVTAYYLVILIVAIIALLLNIFIEIRRQYPSIILSSLGLIFLLAVMIVI